MSYDTGAVHQRRRQELFVFQQVLVAAKELGRHFLLVGECRTSKLHVQRLATRSTKKDTTKGK